MSEFDIFGAKSTLSTQAGKVTLYRLDALEKKGITQLHKLPYSIRILLESVLRQVDNFAVTKEAVENLARWNPQNMPTGEVPFKPARVVLQDFTGVPCVVDLAAMRTAVKKMGGDPKKINPLVPVDLVIDHSVQVDYFGTADAMKKNVQLEFERNLERYEFLKWGQQAFQNFTVVPPATGIIHQVNLEYLAKVIRTQKVGGEMVAMPDTLVGTDSHTTMINGIGIVGWGVGGIEAEACMLGQPLYMLVPQVIGFKLTGKLPQGVTPTDLTLTIVQMLRKKGVVDKFVEFFGPGLDQLPLADRAMVANMAPEYGATMGFFPIDAETLNFMRLTGRSAEEVDLVERYAKEQFMFRNSQDPVPLFNDVLELDMSTIVPCIAGPKRPQDRIALKEVKDSFKKSLAAPVKDRGYALTEADINRSAPVEKEVLKHGSVAIAAITSCTNTSNPTVMLAAGLVAKKAVERGLKVPAYVKTSIAPGSKVVTDYLQAAGLLTSLEKIGFHMVGYGCTTCIGNSGPLPEAVSKAIQQNKLIAAGVLSGNRNFEGRINPDVKANYLASPPLVVAYALAGSVDINLMDDALGKDTAGKPVYLKDIWPTNEEMAQVVRDFVKPEMFKTRYAKVYTENEDWNKIANARGDLYDWKDTSTYIQEPPFFKDLSPNLKTLHDIKSARVLALLGDSVTTDHISPAGNIPAQSPAGSFLQKQGVQKADFNSYGARRGNDRIMTRGTFANIQIKNQLVPGVEGGVTRFLPTNTQMSIFDASVEYIKQDIPLLVIAGKEYGTGSSRDWAAKGTNLLGVKFVIAESFERIHRSNLVGMGVLPLQFKAGENAESLGLTGEEVFETVGVSDHMLAKSEITIRAKRADGSVKEFKVLSRLDTPVDIHYYKNGGILPAVLRSLMA